MATQWVTQLSGVSQQPAVGVAGNCRDKKIPWFQHKQVPVSHGVVNNSSILTFFMMEERKLSRNIIFGDKDHEEMVLDLTREKMVLGLYEDSSCALIGQSAKIC